MALKPRRVRSADGQQGFALAVTLWFLVVFILVVATMGHFLRLEVKTTAFQAEKLRAYYAARAGVTMAMEPLAAVWADGKPQTMVFSGAWRPWKQGRLRGRVWVSHEGGKINLNKDGQGVLQRVLERLGLTPAKASALRDAIFDWVDQDNVPRHAGAEAQFYAQTLGAPGPRNGPIDCLGELTGIAGLEPALLFGLGGRARELGLTPGHGLLAVATVYGDHQAVNINSASPAVLLSLPCMPQRAVRRLLEARARQPIYDYDQARRVLGEEIYNLARNWLTLDANPYYTVVSEGWVEGAKARHSLLAVLRFDTHGRCQVRYWIDDLHYAWPQRPVGDGEK